MGHKDISKELIGKGLRAYHTKAKEVLEKISKDNDKQEYMLQNLIHGVTQNYFTKKERATTVGLDHSKEGVVLFPEIEGDTLVNYCTDGEGTRRLNPYYNEKGDVVTLNNSNPMSGVEVYLEGSTLINRLGKITTTNGSEVTFDPSNNKIEINKPVAGSAKPQAKFGEAIVQPGQLYTLVFDVIKNTLTRETGDSLCKFNIVSYNSGVYRIPKNFTGRVQIALQQPNEVIGVPYFEVFEDTTGEIVIENCMILDGDWSNKILPQYIEENLSSGEDKNNTIELTLQNKNFLDVDRLTRGNATTGFTVDKATGRVEISYAENSRYPYLYYFLTPEEVKYFRGKQVYINREMVQGDTSLNHTVQMLATRIDGTTVWVNQGHYMPEDAQAIRVQVHGHNVDGTANQVVAGTTIYENLHIGVYEMGSTYEESKTTKKTFTFDEPLRRLPNGTTDRVVKIKGKWYLERNIKVLKGVPNVSKANVEPDSTGARFGIRMSDIVKRVNGQGAGVLCSKIPTGANSVWSYNSPGFYILNDEDDMIFIRTEEDMELEDFVEKFKDVEIFYQQKLPTYTEIGNADFTTYDTSTHIYTNATVPAVIKAKNFGYNAEIKPNTKYTIVMRVNQYNKETFVNLGGAEASCGGRRVVITTPSVLEDRCLRIGNADASADVYSVMLLEGEHSDMPHFSGMKSCFESSNNYFELKSVGQNLCDINHSDKFHHENITYKVNGDTIEASNTASDYSSWMQINIKLNGLKIGETYTISCDDFTIENKDMPGIYSSLISIYELTKNLNVVSINLNNGLSQTFTVEDNVDVSDIYLRIHLTTGVFNQTNKISIKNLQITPTPKKIDYRPYKSSTLQVPVKKSVGKWDSISANDTDGIYRVSGHELFDLNGEAEWSIQNIYKNPYFQCKIKSMYLDNNAVDNNSMICDKLATTSVYGTNDNYGITFVYDSNTIRVRIPGIQTLEAFQNWISYNPLRVRLKKDDTTSKTESYDADKIAIPGYDNNTIIAVSTIPPTLNIRYNGEVPIVTQSKTTKSIISNNTTDINDNIVPYLMDMDYRVLMLGMGSEIKTIQAPINQERLYTLLVRDIRTKRYSKEEFLNRIKMYYQGEKLTEIEYSKLEDLLNEY